MKIKIEIEFIIRRNILIILKRFIKYYFYLFQVKILRDEDK